MYTIIGREYCFWCNAAIELLGEPYVYYDYTSLPVLSLLMKKSGMKTVPQIWENAVYIGGYVELEAHIKNKESKL